MNPIAAHAESALHNAPHPALRLTELLELVSRRAGRSLTLERLRTALEDHPDRFRILESWSGPWRVREESERTRRRPDRVRAASGRAGEGFSRARELDGRDAATVEKGDAWVVAVEGPDTPPDAPRPAVRLRESVRWVALGLDGRSRIEVSRWYAIALAERATREAVARRAA